MRALHDIDLRLLRVFKAIVEARGLSGAQILLNSSQSTVSTQLAELEKKLGMRLCARGRAGFSLTPAGRTIYEAAEDLFQAVGRFQNRAWQLSGDMKGTLRLSIVDAMLSNPEFELPKLLHRFNDTAKSVIVDLNIDPPDQMEELLLEEKRDLAIAPTNFGTAGLSYHPLFKERQAIYCGQAHPLHGRSDVTLEMIAEQPFVARRYMRSFDLERTGHKAPNAIVDQMEAQAALILSGNYIGYLPAHYAEIQLAAHNLWRIPPLGATDYDSQFFLIYRRFAEENIVVRAFLNRTRELAEVVTA